MPITLDGRPIGTYLFGVFHTSLGSTLCTESELKSNLIVGEVPSLATYQKMFAQSFLDLPKISQNYVQ